MTRFISRFSAVLALMAATAFSAAPALASGGYDWTDISDKIAERANRPVWAMAYASPYWYLTDGQDLWNGGHVWRTEGTAMADITADVRNAGMSRVDDIVSDGQTVLFLKGITAKNNSFQVLKFNGSFSDASYTLRNQLNSDEGIISLKGKDGMWAMVTSKGRVFLWNTGNNSVTSVLSSTVNYPDYLTYSVYGVSPSPNDAFYAFAVPVSNGWFIGQRQGDINTWGTMRLWLRDTNGNLTDITSKFDTFGEAEFLASNGNSALILTRYRSGPRMTSILRQLYSFDGVNKTSLSSQFYSVDSMFGWSEAIAAHDGSSWLVVERGGSTSQRSALKVDSSTITKLDDVRDYFIDMASNGNGTILLGGAESQIGQTDPNSPLTLKLVKATNSSTTNGNTGSTSGSFGGGKTYSSSNGPNVTTYGNPSDYEVGNGDNFTYRATASDPNGVNRIEMYVNGARVQTCNSDACDYSGIYYTNGLSTRAIPLYAIAYDNYGNSTQTSQETLTVNQSGSSNGGSNTTSGNGMWVTTTVDLGNNSLYRGGSTTYRASAYANQGLNRVELYVNGSLKRTCDYSRSYATQTCEVTIYGSDYSVGQSLNLSAKATDYTGQTLWSDTKYLTVTDTNTGNGNGSTTGQSGNTYFWTWTEPNNATYVKRGETLTYSVGANDADGLKRIEIVVNGGYKRTCDYSRAYGNQTCSVAIYGNDYPVGSQLAVNARITDYNDAEAWTQLQYLTVQDSSYSGSGNSSGDVSAWGWFEPTGSTLSRGNTATYKVQANATQGLQRIEVYADGSLKRTCDFSRSYATQDCDLTVYGNDYTVAQHSFNAKATDYNGKTAWSDSKTLTVQDNGSSNGQNGNTVYWLNPSDRDLATNENFTFTAGASDSDGLQRIDIYVNDSKVQTCSYANAYGSRECTYQIYGSNYPAGSNLYVYAKVTDGYWNTIQTNGRTYRVASPGSSNGGTGDTPATWSWSEPDKSQITTAESVTYRVGAWDADGLNRIEILVNGLLANTCNYGTSVAYGNRECQYTLNGANYKDGDQVYVNAKAVDAQGREGWAAARTYSIKNSGGSSGSTSEHSSWIWSDPNVSDITGGQAVYFHVGAWSASGLRRIEILANGVTMQTCDFGMVAWGNRECSVRVSTSYAGTTHYDYSGHITDGNGNTYNSETKTYTIYNAPAQQPDSNGTVSVSSDHDAGYGASDTIKFTANASDTDGVDRIEILVNAELVKTCYTGSCSFTGGPYSNRTNVTYGARLVDSKGNAYFTGYKTIYKK